MADNNNILEQEQQVDPIPKVDLSALAKQSLQGVSSRNVVAKPKAVDTKQAALNQIAQQSVDALKKKEGGVGFSLTEPMDSSPNTMDQLGNIAFSVLPSGLQLESDPTKPYSQTEALSAVLPSFLKRDGKQTYLPADQPKAIAATNEKVKSAGAAVAKNIGEAHTKKILNDFYLGDLTPEKLVAFASQPYGTETAKKIIKQYLPEENVEDVVLDATKLADISRKISSKNRVNSVETERQFVNQLDSRLSSVLSSGIYSLKNTGAGRIQESIKKPVTSIDFNDPKQYNRLITEIENSDFLVDASGKIVGGSKDENKRIKDGLLKDLRDRYYHTASQLPIDEEINSLDAPIKEALGTVNKMRSAGENVGVLAGMALTEDITSDIFKMGLNFIKNENPARYANVVRAISEKKKIADNDFTAISSLGQEIRNAQIFRNAASDPSLIGKETNFKFGDTYQAKKSEYARAIGDYLATGARGKREYSADEIRRAARASGLSNDKIINDLIREEGILGYDAIPKSGIIEAGVRGFMQPLEGITTTLKNITSSPAENYLRSQRLDVGSSQKVQDELGNQTNRVSSQKESLWVDAIEGLGQFVAQVALTKGVGGTIAGAANVGRASLGRAAMSSANAARAVTYGGTYTSIYMQEYGAAADEMLEKTGDVATARLAGALNGAVAAGFEMLLPDVKIADRAAGIFRKNYATDIIDLVKKGGNPSDIAAKARPLVDRFVKGVLTTGNTLVQETAEEIGTNIGNIVIETIFSPATARQRELGEELWETAKATVVSMSIPSLLAGVGAGRSAQRFSRPHLDYAAINIDEYKRYFDRAVINDAMTPEERDKGIQFLQTHEQSLVSAPEVDRNGTPIPIKKSLDFAFLATQEKYLSNQLKDENKTEVEKEIIREQVAQVQDQQRAILTPTYQEAVTENEEVAIETEVTPTDVISTAIANNEIKGVNADVARVAIDDPAFTETFLKDVADQALNRVAPDITTAEIADTRARESYGNSVVDLAIKTFGNVTETANTQTAPVAQEAGGVSQESVPATPDTTQPEIDNTGVTSVEGNNAQEAAPAVPSSQVTEVTETRSPESVPKPNPTQRPSTQVVPVRSMSEVKVGDTVQWDDAQLKVQSIKGNTASIIGRDSTGAMRKIENAEIKDEQWKGVVRRTETPQISTENQTTQTPAQDDLIVTTTQNVTSPQIISKRNELEDKWRSELRKNGVTKESKKLQQDFIDFSKKNFPVLIRNEKGVDGATNKPYSYGIIDFADAGRYSDMGLFFDVVGGRYTPSKLGKKIGAQATDATATIRFDYTPENARVVADVLQKNGYKTNNEVNVENHPATTTQAAQETVATETEAISATEAPPTPVQGVRSALQQRRVRKAKPSAVQSQGEVSLTPDNVDQVSTPEGAGLKTKMIAEAKQAISALKNLKSNKVKKIRIFDNEADYLTAVGGQKNAGRGGYSQDLSTIYINIPAIERGVAKGESATTMWHESTHPIMNILAEGNPELVNSLYNQILNMSGRNAETDRVLRYGRQQSKKFGEDVGKMETVVEFVAKVANGDIAITPTNKQKIISAINKVIDLLGLPSKLRVGSNVSDIRNLAIRISEALTTGDAQMVDDIVRRVDRVAQPASQKESVQLQANAIITRSLPREAVVNVQGRRILNRDIAEGLHKYYKDNFKVFRSNEFGEKALNAISDYAADEAMLAIAEFGDKSGFGWYSRDYPKAIETLSQIEPLLAKDAEAREAATIMIAISSNSTDVEINLRNISTGALKQFKKTGKLPTDIGKGIGSDAIASGLEKINTIIADHDGDILAAAEFLKSKMPLSESRKIAREYGITPDTGWDEAMVMPVAVSILGAKVGAFYSNLSGIGDLPTIDRWAIRTIARYRGDVRTAATNEELRQYAEEKGIKGNRNTILKEARKDYAKFRAALTKRAGFEKTPYEKRKEVMASVRKGSDLYIAEHGILNDLRGTAAENRRFRSFAFDVMQEGARKVADRTGEPVDVSDMQAILWLYEKKLYETLGVRQDPISTFSAAADRVVSEATQPTSKQKAKTRSKPAVAQAAMQFQGEAGRTLFSDPAPDISRVAEDYKKQIGINLPAGEKIYNIDQENSKIIADAFDEMKHDPSDPVVKAAYQAMADETLSQYQALVNNGYAFELYEGQGEPYANSKEMLDDLRENKHLFVLSTEKDFGQTPITDEQREESPLLRDSGEVDVNGKKLLNNDLFRGVHDAFGHGERGNSFGAKGEENAWDVHARMFTPLARRAMTTETRGQNSWVNFGKHLRNEDGSIKKVPAREKPFADQKIGLLPEWASEIPADRLPVDFQGQGETPAERRRINSRASTQYLTDLKDHYNGILDPRSQFKMGVPTNALLSAGLPDAPIVMRSSTLRYKGGEEYHNLSVTEMADIFDAIQEPIAVFQSATRADSLTVLLDTKRNGKNFLVAIEKSRNGGRGVNVINSLYPIDKPARVTGWMNDNLMEWVDKKKASEFASQQSNSAGGTRGVTNIINNFENPKSEIYSTPNDFQGQPSTENTDFEDDDFGANPDTIDDALELLASDLEKGMDQQSALNNAVGFIKATEGDNFSEDRFREYAQSLMGAPDISGVRHADIEARREEFGMGERTTGAQTFEDVRNEADAVMGDMFAIRDVIDKVIFDKQELNPTELEILGRYISSLEPRLRDITQQIEQAAQNKEEITDMANRRDKILTDLSEAYEAAERTGTMTARALNYRKVMRLMDESLASMFAAKAKANHTTILTDAQIADVIKEHDAIAAARDKYESKITELKKKLQSERAKNRVRKVKEATPKTKSKTHEDFVKERSKIVEQMKEKLRQMRGQSYVAVLPYAPQLVEAAPFVAKLVKSYVSEGISNLSNIIDEVHTVLKDGIPEITKDDVNDIIAGNYDQKKPAKNELLETLRNLKTQAQLQNKLDELLAGGMPETENKRQKYTREISDLRNTIRGLKREMAGEEVVRRSGERKPRSEADLLKAMKSRTKTEIAKIEKQLETGDFSKETPMILALDEEAKDLRDQLTQLRAERQKRLMQDEYAARSTRDKLSDALRKGISLPRELMASADLSAPLRQGLVASFAHPLLAAKAFVEMHKQAASQKKFDRWLQELRDSEAYPMMMESGLYVADQNNPEISAREEVFGGNLGEKIPLMGRIVKASARGYATYLNVLRVNMFLNAVGGFKDAGMTFENSPEVYKGWASFVNSATGRGGLGKAEIASNILSSMYFSPRLIASRANLLGLSDLFLGVGGGKGFYMSMPKELRKMVAFDMAKFIGVASSFIAGLAMWAGDDDEPEEYSQEYDENGNVVNPQKRGFSVETDPRSSDFAKIRVDNTRWDLLGGFQQYIRAIAQVASGKRKALSTENTIKAKREGVAFNFNRSKLSPVTGLVYSATLGEGKNMVGEDIWTVGHLSSYFIPMIWSDMYETYQDPSGGVMKALASGLSNFYGASSATYETSKGSQKVDKPR